MPGQEAYKIEFDRNQQYGGNTYNHISGNAVEIPRRDTDYVDVEEIKPRTFLSWVRANIPGIVIAFALIAMLGAFCYMQNRMVTSNAEYKEAAAAVDQLRRDASSGRENYNNRLANTDIEGFAKDELGMVPAEEQVDITLEELPR